MALTDIIIDKIKAAGRISFRDFMDMCLYYPNQGYYTSDREKIGKEGDFYTSSTLSSSFGAAIARQIEEMWHFLGEKEFTIVEYGAGTGMLCHDILDQLKKNPLLYSHLRYCIIEKSSFMRKKEKEHLTEKVSWYDSIDGIPQEIDCVFSNELIDNLPVHQVIMEDQLMEVFVDYREGFREILQPATSELINYFNELQVDLPKGYRTEVNLEAVSWIKSIAERLKKGFVITIDYGDVSKALYKPHRDCGTVVCYYKHQVMDDPFFHIGEQDITAHINFSALMHWGAQAGLNTCGITSQASFLLSLGFRELIREANLQQGKDILQMAMEESFVSRTLLFDMGNRYKVLIQSKGLPEISLQGLQPDMR
ncbi:class I SAM-dependent methyltransferase [Chitinophaga sp. 30R24]|uniref:class I SAM-dependent methyltransferase n=1 Tax=Chitinophaga sp. 30R24 TaxID=3248838 RepID=UPI003B91C4D7